MALTVFTIAAVTGPARAASSPPRSLVAARSIALATELLAPYTKGEATGSNAVLSPASLMLALGMLQQGAEGKTSRQLAKLTGVSDADTLRSELGRLTTLLTAVDPLGAVVISANRVYVQRGFSIEPRFLERTASFGAPAEIVDFQADPRGATNTINAWVSQQTQAKIPNLLGPLEPQTRSALINALTLKATWSRTFSQPVGSTFTTAKRERKKVPTLSDMSMREFAARSGWKAVSIDYSSSTGLRFVAVLPPKGVHPVPTPKVLDGLVSNLRASQVTLRLPTFSTGTTRGLNDDIRRLGAPMIFTLEADLSGIHKPTTCQDQLYVSLVVQKAKIDLDERGTEAVATTAVVPALPASAEPIFNERKASFIADRPFFYVILGPDDFVLFAGVINDPSAPDAASEDPSQEVLVC